MLKKSDVSYFLGSDPSGNVCMMLCPAYSRSDKSGGKFDVSSFYDSELVLDETDPLEVHVPRGLIFMGQLRKFIARYHIPPDFVCKVPASNDYISTLGALKVAFHKKAFRARLRIPLYPFIALFL